MQEFLVERQLIERAAALKYKDFFPATDGNFSCRLNSHEFLITPTAKAKSDLRPGDMVVIDKSGRKIRGKFPPSSEYDMHLAIYEFRPDVDYIVHAHPPFATAFAVAGKALEAQILPEIIQTIGIVPITEFAKPGSRQVRDSINGIIQKHDALLLRNHGVVAVGNSMEDAFDKMERVEHFAKILAISLQIGTITELKPTQLE